MRSKKNPSKKEVLPKSQRRIAKSLLASLIKGQLAKPRHEWQELADLFCESDGIIDASASGFTIAMPDGSRHIEIEGGWTEEHYEFLGPFLKDLTEPELNRAMLAEAVLRNRLMRDGCPEPDTAWWLLCNHCGSNEENWLPQLVATDGFAHIQKVMSQALDEYRKTTPRTKVSKKTKPRWDADLGRLWVGDQLIKKYTEAAENQRLYLDAFQDAEWRHRVDDPLCVKSGEPIWKRQRRRRETIAGLKDDHVTPGIISFRSDGTGDGIIWDWCK